MSYNSSGSKESNRKIIRQHADNTACCLIFFGSKITPKTLKKYVVLIFCSGRRPHQKKIYEKLCFYFFSWSKGPPKKYIKKHIFLFFWEQNPTQKTKNVVWLNLGPQDSFKKMRLRRANPLSPNIFI